MRQWRQNKLSDYHHPDQEGWEGVGDLITSILLLMWPKLICTSSFPGPHVSCERMTPPLPLSSSPTSDASSDESKLDLKDWTGSLPSFSFPMSSKLLWEDQKNFRILLPAFPHSHSSFPRYWLPGHEVWSLESTMAEIARAWSQGLLSTALISHKHAKAKQRLATFRPTSWCNYTLRKLTRRRGCCCRSIQPSFTCVRGSARGWEGGQWLRFNTTVSRPQTVFCLAISGNRECV